MRAHNCRVGIMKLKTFVVDIIFGKTRKLILMNWDSIIVRAQVYLIDALCNKLISINSNNKSIDNCIKSIFVQSRLKFFSPYNPMSDIWQSIRIIFQL